MITGGYSAPATVCALGLPRYTPTDVPPCSRDDRTETVGDRGERLVPRGFGQHAVPPHERPRQPVGVVVELGEARAFRTDETVAEHVVAVAAGAGEPAVVDRQGQAAGGLAQRADAQSGIQRTRGCLRSCPSSCADYSCSYTLGSSVPM